MKEWEREITLQKSVSKISWLAREERKFKFVETFCLDLSFRSTDSGSTDNEEEEDGIIPVKHNKVSWIDARRVNWKVEF